MKKLLSLIMVLVLALSLSAPMWAAGTTGSITITNATIGQTYNLYKFFDATYAVDSLGNTIVDSDGKAIVSYTIDNGNQFFDDMFGVDGNATNEYFVYEKSSGVVTKRSGVSDSAIIAYLDGLASTATPEETITATSDVVIFDNIDTGYYLIDRGISSIVTVTSNIPNIEVIDKNQKPDSGEGFDKLVFDEDTGTWVEVSSANIGDVIDWKLTFESTNYDGDDIVMYYTIRDVKSSSLWVEFDDITVTVDGVTLDKGYYYCADNSIATGEWEFLGNWGSDTNPNNAQWYLIHYTYDEFEIVIPWLDDYVFSGVQSNAKGYNLTFDLDKNDGNSVLSESKYDSPASVVVEYSAAVGPDAANSIAKNSATLDWVTPEGTFGPEDPETTETKVYNLGITKTANDGTSTSPATRLEGAIFELYKDSDCTQPIYVIPTNNPGVYILDDVDTIISGTNRKSVREYYAGYWESYIGSDVTKKRNDMETPASGQLVIMGLESGTYYLKETKAPEGYNLLVTPVEVVVGSGSTAFYDNDYKTLSGDDVTYAVYNATVENNRGVELPSTGGEGTFWLITIGTLLVIGFAVFLITHKKMSVYTD